MKTHVAAGRTGQRTETEKAVGNETEEMRRDEDVTLIEMKIHME